jgi:hypothetical protein
MDRAVRATVAVSSAPRCLRLMRSESTHPRPASGLREKQHSRDSGPRRSLRTTRERLVWRSRDSSFAMAKRASGASEHGRVHVVQLDRLGSDRRGVRSRANAGLWVSSAVRVGGSLQGGARPHRPLGGSRAISERSWSAPSSRAPSAGAAGCSSDARDAALCREFPFSPGGRGRPTAGLVPRLL